MERFQSLVGRNSKQLSQHVSKALKLLQYLFSLLCEATRNTIRTKIYYLKIIYLIIITFAAQFKTIHQIFKLNCISCSCKFLALTCLWLSIDFTLQAKKREFKIFHRQTKMAVKLIQHNNIVLISNNDDHSWL